MYVRVWLLKKLERWDLAKCVPQLDQLKYLLLNKVVCIVLKNVDQEGGKKTSEGFVS